MPDTITIERKRMPLELKFAEGAPEGTFSGHGAIFGNTDQGGDVIAKGAFSESIADIRRNGDWPDMLLQHGFGWTSADMMPIGVWTKMEEDTIGLAVEGQIALDVPRARDAYNLMKTKPRPALRGLSIGYEVKREDVEYGDGQTAPKRTLKKIKLFEVSVVTSPMNRRAQISAVKSISDLKREIAMRLREAGVASRSEAERAVAACFDTLDLRDADKSDAKLSDILASLREIKAALAR